MPTQKRFCDQGSCVNQVRAVWVKLLDCDIKLAVEVDEEL